MSAVSFGGVRALVRRVAGCPPRRDFRHHRPERRGQRPRLFNVISGPLSAATGRVTLDGRDVTGLPPHRAGATWLVADVPEPPDLFPHDRGRERDGGPAYARRTVTCWRICWRSVGKKAKSADAGNRAMNFSRWSVFAVWPTNRPEACLMARSSGSKLRAQWRRSPVFCLLDEPAAGCNPIETEEVDDVIKTISSRGVTIVLVEHDMRLVMKISDRIHVLDHGTTLADGDAAAVRSNPAVIAAYLGTHGKMQTVLSVKRSQRAAMAGSKSCTAFHSRCRKARSSPLSARTAPARRRCCAPSPGVQPATAGSIVFAGSPIAHLRPHRRVALGISQVPEGRQVFALTVGCGQSSAGRH